ncbi:hypothetical protein [Actinoplanes sp. GCM10030250]|uniref:hypothetical protein n=1 Tax=Actinoplanes sp. GCM10030250 TaxID=3273376 RepID=UPI003611C088
MKAIKRAALAALVLAGTSGVVGVTIMPSDAATTPGATDYIAGSWANYSAKKTTADKLVMVRGLKSLVADYQKRVPANYTASTWAPFAKALTTASTLAADASATAPQVAAAKTTLTASAAALVAADEGTFQTITNNTFWKDTSGNPIYSQGGGVFKFGGHWSARPVINLREF